MDDFPDSSTQRGTDAAKPVAGMPESAPPAVRAASGPCVLAGTEYASEQTLRSPVAAEKASPIAGRWLPRSGRNIGGRHAAGKPRRLPGARVNRPAASRCRPWLWNAASILSLIVALVCLALLPPFGGKSAVDPEPTKWTATTSRPSLPTIPIERIRPGDWALAHNPELSDEERWGPGDGLRPEGNPDGWRLISMRLQKDDGGYVDIELLRPLEWIERHRVEVGGQVDVELTELGGAGWAEVFNIRACPPIGPPPGAGFRVVTGRYAHSAGDTFDLRITGLDGQPDLTIGVTATHPIWSVDEDDFVAAGDLLPGERLLTATGQIAHVHSLTPRPGPEPVYNLEVDVEHVYYVSHAGVLVHNAKALTCATPGSAKPPRSAAARLPKLKGKSEHQVRKVLEESGFKRTKVSNSPGRNETWVHPDGSEVRIHPYGNLKQAPYKSANNAHIHKQDPLGSQLNDRGFPSTNPVDTHIGIPNPGDFPTVRGRPHGAGTQ